MSGRAARLGLGVVASLLVAVQLPVLARTAGDPSQSDFANYFTPAFVLAKGGDLGALYDPGPFEQAMRQAGLSGLGSFVPHPPANALWLLPFAGMPPEIAKAVWTVLLLLGIAFSIWAVHRLSPAHPLQAVVIVLAPVLAIRNGLAFGQPYLVLAAWLVGGVLALERGRSFLGGFLLGLGVSFKPYALGIGFLFLHRDRNRSLLGFACGVAAPALALLILAGAGPFVEFLSKVVPWMLRGDIQDPFSPGWGSAGALINRLLRSEPDLNPQPWLEAPLLARFLGALVSGTLLILGCLLGRRAMDSKRPLDAVGIVVAFALAASPFVASYHLVLLMVPVLGVGRRLHGGALYLWLLGWAALGSSLVNTFREVEGALTPLAYIRFFGILILAMTAGRAFMNRRVAGMAVVFGAGLGVFALPWGWGRESWPRIAAAKGYSMSRPYFCEENLRWWSPSSDGRRVESRGDGPECALKPPLPKTSGPSISSRFTDGSWNVYLREGGASPIETRVTFSDSNEIDPVLTPDGCAFIFASDQDRGLGSTALYRADISALIEGCEGQRPAAAPR